MTTIETLTDAQIETLSAEAAAAGDLDMVRTCQTALGAFDSPRNAAVRETVIESARKSVVSVIRDAEAQANS